MYLFLATVSSQVLVYILYSVCNVDDVEVAFNHIDIRVEETSHIALGTIGLTNRIVMILITDSMHSVCCNVCLLSFFVVVGTCHVSWK